MLVFWGNFTQTRNVRSFTQEHNSDNFTVTECFKNFTLSDGNYFLLDFINVAVTLQIESKLYNEVILHLTVDYQQELKWYIRIEWKFPVIISQIASDDFDGREWEFF